MVMVPHNQKNIMSDGGGDHSGDSVGEESAPTAPSSSVAETSKPTAATPPDVTDGKSEENVIKTSLHGLDKEELMDNNISNSTISTAPLSRESSAMSVEAYNSKPPAPLSPSSLAARVPAASMMVDSHPDNIMSSSNSNVKGPLKRAPLSDQSDQEDSATEDEETTLKSPPETEMLKSPPELPLPRRTSRRSTRRSAAKRSGNSVHDSSHFDGEFALSVLNARPRDGRTGRRVSTMGDDITASATAASATDAAASAAAAVGAFAAKNDEQDNSQAKKKEEEERRRKNSSQRDTSTFEERLMRKLSESRGSERSASSGISTPSDMRGSVKSGASGVRSLGGRGGAGGASTRMDRRRSSRVSFASSIGSAYESIDEGKQSNFEEAINKMAGFDLIDEGMNCLDDASREQDDHHQEEWENKTTGKTRSGSYDEFLGYLNEGNESVTSDHSVGAAIPERPSSESDINNSPRENFHRKRRSEGACWAPTRNNTNNSAQQNLHRKHRSEGNFRRVTLDSSTSEDFIMRKVAERGNVGMTYSERKRREAEEENSSASAAATSTQDVSQETIRSAIINPLPMLTADEALNVDQGEKIAELHANGHSEDGHVVDRFFYQPAPKVRDEEEEKVELSSESDVQSIDVHDDTDEVFDAPYYASPGGNVPPDPVHTVSDIEKQIEKKSRENPGSQRALRCDNNSPFSSMIEERKKVATHHNSLDPEDLVAGSDLPPGTVTNPAELDFNQSDSNLSGSFTSVMNMVRRGSLSRRTLSMVDMNGQSVTAPSPDQAGRRGTYAFGTNAEEHSQALRQLADMVEAQDIVQATLVEEEEPKPMETVEAIPMDDDDEALQLRKRRKLRKQIILVWAPLAFLVIVIVGAILGTESNGGSNDAGGDANTDALTKDIVYDPMLVQLKKEGVLRCGVPNKYGFASVNEATGQKEGMSVDLCKAVAAAVLGDDYEVDLIEVTSTTRFTALAGREIDLLMYTDTHTMERDFHEGRTRVGFQFTDPYFYDGLGFAGQPNAVKCADGFNWLRECRDLKICVIDGTTHVDVLTDIFPLQNLILKGIDEFYQAFVDGDCAVIAGEQNDISVTVVRMAGYEGEFVTGDKILSKEPLAMVTRKHDQSWTDVANWVLRALIHAEITNVTQDNALELQHTSYYENVSGIDFNRAVKEVGNYGEIYARNMEEVVPRKGLNHIYNAAGDGNLTTGLLYSHPTGVIDTYRHDFAPGGKINQILDRGKLICGIFGDESQSMDTDYCLALAASLFASDSSKIEFFKLSTHDNLMEILDNGDVDVIAGVAVSLHSDIMPSNETESGLSGLAFSQPYFYEGDYYLSFFDKGSLAPKAMATSDADADWSTYVYWVINNSIWAEEKGITSADYREVPEVKLFGEQFSWMFLGQILGSGNHGEIYERNIENLPSRADHNLLNDGSSPQLWNP